MDKNNKKGIIVNVDLNIYSNLKSEQRRYHINMQKKISLADVIMHYYSIGNAKAEKSLYSGLRVIDDKEEKIEKEVKTELSGINTTDSLTKSMLTIIENREEALKIKEEQLTKREELVIEKLFGNKDSVNDKLLNQSQVDFARLNVEFAFLKEELESYKKTQTNSAISEDFNRIEKSLALIEKQTKKSTLESILPFATPLIVILGYFLMNKKVDDKMNIEGIQKQIGMIYKKLNKKDQKTITRVVERTFDDIL